MLEIQTKTKNSTVIIGIQGDVDLYSSPQVRKIILDQIKKKIRAIFVNLEKVNYMDSSGVASLVEGLQRIKEYGGNLFIYNLQGAVRDVFELSRLDKVFNIFENEFEALKAYDEKN